ncbi:MAG: SAM-dependent methyltransferase [Verrucomicrobiota bacterium]
MSEVPDWLVSIIQQAGGWISFERFMAEALYDTEHGYYQVNVSAIGRDGDFSTSGTLTQAFGEAIAHWASNRARTLFPDNDFCLIEVGAGSGDLARSLQASWSLVSDRPWRYQAVETSQRLGEQLSAMGFQVETSLSTALRSCGGRALIISNELPDAFPARQLIWQHGDWQEVGVELRDGRLVEVFVPFRDAVDAEALSEPREGQRLFVHPHYHHWLRTELAGWDRGSMLTIDYGAVSPSFECRAYREQQRQEGDAVYAMPGSQDITCDVNFSDLRRWGEDLGLSTQLSVAQWEFLEDWLPNATERAKSDEALQFVMYPFGAGGAFRVLEQQRQ